MKPRTKSILALSGTLIVGLVVGSLVTMSVIRHRINEFKEMRQPKHFKEHLLQAADPSPEQEAQIDPLIQRFGQQMQALHQSHKTEVETRLDILKDSLALYLDQRQMKRINRKLTRMKGRMTQPPFKKGPRDRPKRDRPKRERPPNH